MTHDSTSMAVNSSLVTHVASPASTSGSARAADTMSPTLSESNTVARAHTPISANVRHTTARTPQIVATTLRQPALSAVSEGSSTTSSATSAVIRTASQVLDAPHHTERVILRYEPGGDRLGYCAGVPSAPPDDDADGLVQRTLAWLNERFQRYEDRPLVDVGLRIYQRDRDITGTVVGSAIAFRLFLFFVPLLLFVVGIAGFVSHLIDADDVNDDTGLTGNLAAQIDTALSQPTQTRWVAVGRRVVRHRSAPGTR